jgi:hypothetical protein
MSGQPLCAFFGTTAHCRKIQIRVVAYGFCMFAGHLTGPPYSNTQVFFIMPHFIFSATVNRLPASAAAQHIETPIGRIQYPSSNQIGLCCQHGFCAQ